MKKRIVSFLLVFTMMLSTFGQSSVYVAKEAQDETHVTSSSAPAYNDVIEDSDVIVHISPLTRELYSGEAVEALSEYLREEAEENHSWNYADNVDYSAAVYETMEDAADYMRKQMVLREGNIQVTLDRDALGSNSYSAFFYTLVDEAMAYSEDCTGQEGDAILMGYSGWSGSYSYSSTQITYKLTITYRTTYEQEQELTSAVDAALEKLGLDGKTDYQKARAIYDFVCDTVDYDYEHLNSSEDYPLMYTSYAAMCNGTSVCQGYALLYYRMCKDAGLSARYIRGYANNGNHGWNIVRIGDVYYNADATWDGQEKETYHNYFLQNMTDFTDHTRRDEYTTDEFMAEFPMAADSWSDYSNLKETEPYENFDTTTFTTVDGKTATNTANGKVKLLVFGRVNCTYTRNTINSLSQGKFDDIDIVYCDFDRNDLTAVTNFRDTYGSASDGISYAYSTDYTINNLMWDYIYLYNNTGTVTLPVLVFIDENNKVKYYASGGTFSADYVRNCIDTYLGDYEFIEISNETLTMNPGETKTPQVKIQGIVRNNQFLTWSTSNEAVAAVDAAGKITAKTAGTAVITCKANDNVYITCRVTVKSSGLLSTPVITSVSNETTGVKIKWNAVDGAEKYRVFRKTVFTNWTTIGDTTSTSFTDTTGLSGTTYYYTVRCISSDSSTFMSNFDTVGKGIKYIATPQIASLEAKSNGVKVSWDAIRGAERYCIFRKTGTGNWSIIGYTTGTSYADATAKTGTTYAYTIRCMSSDGKTFTSAYSSTGKSIKYVDMPKVSAVEVKTNGVKISWSAVAGAEKYCIFRKTGTGNWTILGYTTGTSYADTTVVSGNTYTYTLRCVSSNGKNYTSAYDATGKAIAYGSSQLDTPQISSVEAKSNGIKISWSAVTGAEKYCVFRKTGTGNWRVIGYATGTSYADTTTQTGNTYTYTLRCISSDGKTFMSGYNGTGTSITYVQTPVISVVEAKSNGIKISWSAVSGAEKYCVFRKSGTGNWNIIGYTTGTTFADTTAKKGTTYTYTLRCVSSDGKVYASSYDGTGLSIVYQSGQLVIPKVNTLTNVDGGIKVSWNAVSGATRYCVFRKTGTGKWTTIGYTTGTSFTDTTAIGGTAYEYTLRCTSSDGKTFTSGYDNTGKSIVRVETPQIFAVEGKSNGVKVSWSAVAGAEKYCVFRKTANGNWNIIGYTTGNTFADTTAVKGTTYTYTVRCVSSDGKSFTSGYDTTGVSIKY